MASPFNIFRKRQRTLLVVIGVICIFTFVVGDFLLSWMGADTRAGRAADTVVSWKGGELNETDLAVLRGQQHLAVAYVDRLLEETNARKGTPKAAGLMRTDSELVIVRTLLLAEEAQKLGMEVPDEAIIAYLAQLTDHTLSSEDLRKLLIEATGGRLTRDQLFATLRRELLARNYLRVVASGDTMTPEDAWGYYNRLTRRATVSAVGLPAEDYLDQTPQPTQQQLQAFYDKYKDQYPQPTSPDPGFKERPRFEFAYFKADYDKFLEEEKQKITAEEIQQHYEKNKENYKVPELPGARSGIDLNESAFPLDLDPPAAPAEPAKPEESGTPNEPKETEAPPPAETPSTPAEGKPDDTPASPTEDAPPAEPSAPPEDQQEVCAQPGEAAGDDAASTAPEEERPATGSDNSSASEPAEAAADAPPATTEPAPEENATSPAKEPQETKQEPSPPAEAEKAPKYRALHEVEDDIRRALAAPKARERMEKALAQAKRAVDAYERSYRNHLARPNSKAPETPNFDALAKELGLEYAATPLVDEMTVGETELGKTFQFAAGFQQIPFAQIAMQNDQVGLYRTGQITSGLDEYLFWPTKVEPAQTPPLSEIRDRVVRSWRLQKAFDIAMQKAEQMAAKVRQAPKDQPMAEAAGVKESQVIRPPAFSWMTSGAVAFGGGMPYLSEVEGIENAGPEFMEKTFALQPGEVAVAPNQPKNVAYVIRLEGETPGEAIRRDLFWQTGVQFNYNLRAIAEYEQQRKILAWLDEMEKAWQLEWKRPPHASGGAA